MQRLLLIFVVIMTFVVGVVLLACGMVIVIIALVVMFVVMITAYGDAENRRRAMESGASDFVTKPVDFAELKHTLEAHAAGIGR